MLKGKLWFAFIQDIMQNRKKQWQGVVFGKKLFIILHLCKGPEHEPCLQETIKWGFKHCESQNFPSLIYTFLYLMSDY